MKPIQVGLLGIGTVGGGTWEVLARNAGRVEVVRSPATSPAWRNCSSWTSHSTSLRPSRVQAASDKPASSTPTSPPET